MGRRLAACVVHPQELESFNTSDPALHAGAEGFSLLEIKIVVTLILIAASITTPIHTRVDVRARGVVLANYLMAAVSSQPLASTQHAEG